MDKKNEQLQRVQKRAACDLSYASQRFGRYGYLSTFMEGTSALTTEDHGRATVVDDERGDCLTYQEDE